MKSGLIEPAAASRVPKFQRHCVEAPWLDLSLGAFTALGEGERPESTSG
jgi:hypothetical protein